MAWSYRKRVKIIPGVHLNFSKKGISTSIGAKGLSINFSSNSTTVSTNILGISNRQKFKNSNPTPESSSNYPDYYTQNNLYDNIFSADIHEITSQNVQGIKEAILLAHHQKKELAADLIKIRKALSITKTKKILSYLFLYGFINKNIKKNANRDIKIQLDAINQTENMIEKCCVNLDINFDPEIQRKFETVYEAFKHLMASHKIWDITSAHFQDRIVARSSASTVVNRREIRFALKSLPYIQSEYQAMYLKNANGADIYIYPAFIIMYTNETNFAIIGIDELNLHHTYTYFRETSIVPRDSKIIDHTWAKVNKNGTRDKRFSNNYKIPVVKYGNINFTTKTGMHEEYEFSNYESAEEFSRAFSNFQREFI